jgi:hypothetical protein
MFRCLSEEGRHGAAGLGGEPDLDFTRSDISSGHSPVHGVSRGIPHHAPSNCAIDGDGCLRTATPFRLQMRRLVDDKIEAKIIPPIVISV